MSKRTYGVLSFNEALEDSVSGLPVLTTRSTLNDLANHVELLKAAGRLPRRDDPGLSPSRARRASQLASPDSQASPTSVPGAASGIEQDELQTSMADWPIERLNAITNTDSSPRQRLPPGEPTQPNHDALTSLAPPAPRAIGNIRLSSLQVRQTFEM